MNLGKTALLTNQLDINFRINGVEIEKEREGVGALEYRQEKGI